MRVGVSVISWQFCFFQTLGILTGKQAFFPAEFMRNFDFRKWQ